jgi:hypothetical protein
MQNQFVISISMLLLLGASPLSMAFASTETSNEDFLNIREATIDADSDEMSAFLETHGPIPTNGDGGPFGYGILTSEGLDAVVVSTTHAGVLDSEEQSDANDPVWHNHFVTLVSDSKNCGDDPAVQYITFESPGQVNIEDNSADITQIPSSFSGTDAFSGDDLTIEPGTDVDDVVSFKLSPQFNDDEELQAVCVTDIQSAENIVFSNDSNNGNNNDSNNGNNNDSNNGNNNDSNNGNNNDSNNGNNNDSNNGNNNNDDNRDSSNGNSASQGIGQSQGNTQ